MKSGLFRRLVRGRRLLPYCVESALELTAWKFVLLCFPFRIWSRWSGFPRSETLQADRETDSARIDAIRRSVELMSGLTPWPSKCLDRALAAQHMLARRGLSSTLYYGMIRDEGKAWQAHAWVRCGSRMAIGYQPERLYTVVGTYAKVVQEGRGAGSRAATPPGPSR